MLGWFLNGLRTEKTESESISFRKHWYFLGMLSSEIILEKKPLKISHNSVSLEIFLPFSIRLIFPPFKGLFVKRGIIVFQTVFLSVILSVLLSVICPAYCSMFFLWLSAIFQNFFDVWSSFNYFQFCPSKTYFLI